MMARGVWLLVVMMVVMPSSTTASPNHHLNMGHQHEGKGKLLYILFDGFRWDYLENQPSSNLPGFTRFLMEGGRAQWTNPLFPSISYPSWTTLVTGQYAETHGIVGNYFYDPVDNDVFSLFDNDATGKQKWWTSEPLWTTAEKAGLKTAQFLWSRCDVPINGVTTHFCEKFVKIPGKEIFQQNIGRALDKLTEGYDLVQVYTEHTDFNGHNNGPDSPEIVQAVRDLDKVILYLLNEVRDRELDEEVNIVIVSDHGMIKVSPDTGIVRYEIDDFLDTELVENIADGGAFMNIKVSPQNIDKVFEQLSKMAGVSVYRHDDIPDKFHYKNNKYIHDIILLADIGYYLMPSRSAKQLPPRGTIDIGAHGYSPEEKEMKGIFFAKGPAFKCGWTLEPINIVDIYQVLTHTLGIHPQPHNGTWSHVEGSLARSDGDDGTCVSAGPHSVAPFSLSLVVFFLFSVVFA